MGHRQLRHARGFALIEALIALLILSGGLIALSHLQIRMLKASGETQAQTTAVHLAEHKLEELRGLAFEELRSGSDQPLAQPGHSAHFSRRWTIGQGGTETLRTVAVTTTWEDAEGVARSVTLSTLIAQSPAGPIDPLPAGGTNPAPVP
jgi:Tfp pilus assembly protein PilV